MQHTVFERCHALSAADVARRAGLPLKRSGGREWACCPLHQEKTASLCFYPDGRWYCFGCHAHGDAVDLYAALYGKSKLEAATALAEDRALPRYQPQKRYERPPFLDGVDDSGYTWDQLCAIKHRAQESMEDEKPDSAAFWHALQVRSVAEDRINQMMQREE